MTALAQIQNYDRMDFSEYEEFSFGNLKPNAFAFNPKRVFRSKRKFVNPYVKSRPQFLIKSHNIPLTILSHRDKHAEQREINIQYLTNSRRIDVRKKLITLLKSFTLLQRDWDGYDAPEISNVAIKNCQMAIYQIPNALIKHIELEPNEFGGVMLRLNVEGQGMLVCDFGDETMSYFVERTDGSFSEYPFVKYCFDAYLQLALNISSLKAE